MNETQQPTPPRLVAGQRVIFRRKLDDGQPDICGTVYAVLDRAGVVFINDDDGTRKKIVLDYYDVTIDACYRKN